MYLSTRLAPVSDGGLVVCGIFRIVVMINHSHYPVYPYALHTFNMDYLFPTFHDRFAEFLSVETVYVHLFRDVHSSHIG